MATRMNILKLMQEIHGFARVTHRRPQPRPPGLFLMQMRAYGLPVTSPKRKLNITFQLQETVALPHPVKINHLSESQFPIVFVPTD
jgi:hypothetical protein